MALAGEENDDSWYTVEDDMDERAVINQLRQSVYLLRAEKKQWEESIRARDTEIVRLNGVQEGLQAATAHSVGRHMKTMESLMRARDEAAYWYGLADALLDGIGAVLMDAERSVQHAERLFGRTGPSGETGGPGMGAGPEGQAEAEASPPAPTNEEWATSDGTGGY